MSLLTFLVQTGLVKQLHEHFKRKVAVFDIDGFECAPNQNRVPSSAINYVHYTRLANKYHAVCIAQ